MICIPSATQYREQENGYDVLFFLIYNESTSIVCVLGIKESDCWKRR